MVSCRRFVQRDMDVSGLGFAVGTTPFEDVPAILEFPRLFDDVPEGICGTGDRFETGAPVVTCDVIDMEAYALAKACRVEGACHVGVARHVTSVVCSGDVCSGDVCLGDVCLGKAATTRKPPSSRAPAAKRPPAAVTAARIPVSPLPPKEKQP